MRIFSLSFAIGLIWVLLSPPSTDQLTPYVAFAMLLFLWFGSTLARCFCAGFLISIVIATAQVNAQFEQQIPAWVKGKNLLVVGKIVGVPKHDLRRTNFSYLIESVTLEPGDNSAKKNLHALAKLRGAQVQLSWYAPQARAIATGERWQFTLRLKPPNSLGNEGSFDYARWLFQQRIQGTGYVKNRPPAKRVQHAKWSLNGFRIKAATLLEELSAANEQVAMVQGLSVGLSHGIDERTWDILRQSGTAHLLAISGLHIGLVMTWSYGFVLLLFRVPVLRKLPWDRPSFAAVVGLSMASIYAALAGFSLPTQRALLMIFVAMLSLLFRVHWPRTTALLFALLAVLLIDAFSVLSAGFWLSFGTVAALCYLHVGRINRRRMFTQAMALHVKLGFVLLPASVWFFHQGSLIAPVANAIAVPVVAIVVVPLSLLSLGLASINVWLANVLLGLAQYLLFYLLLVLEKLLHIPWAKVALYVPNVSVLLCLCLSLVLLFGPRGIRMRWLCVPLFSPFLLANVIGEESANLEVHALDVGQGLAIVVFTPNRTLLFDTGASFSEDTSMYTRVVAPFLHAKGRRRIDTLVVSHNDNDHSGGAKHVAGQNIDVQVYASEPEALTPSTGTVCRAGESWQWDGVVFSFVHPAKGDFGSKNDQSCVLLIHHGLSRVLLTGDIEADGEAQLVSRMPELPVTLLVAPHHGSKSSSSDAFLAKIRPQHVIFAAGYANKFGFPHEQVQMRYKLNGSLTYVTGLMGALSFEFDRSGLRGAPAHYWHSHRRYWNIDRQTELSYQ